MTIDKIKIMTSWNIEKKNYYNIYEEKTILTYILAVNSLLYDFKIRLLSF
jgi:hypothetical protein